MSVHIFAAELYVAFSQRSDRKYLPDGMEIGSWYRVIGYENGTVKRQDGTKGEALYFHFVGPEKRPYRLIQSNVLLHWGSNPPAIEIESDPPNDGFPG